MEPLENLSKAPHCEKVTFPVGVDILKRGVVHFQMPPLKYNTLLERIVRGVGSFCCMHRTRQTYLLSRMNLVSHEIV